MIILFTKFILSAALILIFGFRLSKTAHSIVKMGRFTEGFMGVVLLAAITSFPEIFTSIASATYVDAINLGIGDLIGSVMLNLMVIAVLDFKYGKGALLSIVDKDLIASCAFSFIMLGLIMAALGLSVFTGKVIGIFNIGLESFLLIIIYLYIVTHSFKKTLSDSGEKGRRHEKEGKAFLVFALYGIIIIAGSFWLTSVSKDIVDKMGWNEMYFGTTVIALATSLPEIVVSMTALSIGSANMAIANIIGSNIFDIAIIPVIDIIYRKGYLFLSVSASHIYSCLLAIILTLIVFASMLYKPRTSFMRLGVGSIALIIIFVAGNILLYNLVH